MNFTELTNAVELLFPYQDIDSLVDELCKIIALQSSEHKERLKQFVKLIVCGNLCEQTFEHLLSEIQQALSNSNDDSGLVGLEKLYTKSLFQLLSVLLNSDKEQVVAIKINITRLFLYFAEKLQSKVDNAIRDNLLVDEVLSSMANIIDYNGENALNAVAFFNLVSQIKDIDICKKLVAVNVLLPLSYVLKFYRDVEVRRKTASFFANIVSVDDAASLMECAEVISTIFFALGNDSDLQVREQASLFFKNYARNAPKLSLSFIMPSSEDVVVVTDAIAKPNPPAVQNNMVAYFYNVVKKADVGLVIQFLENEYFGALIKCLKDNDDTFVQRRIHSIFADIAKVAIEAKKGEIYNNLQTCGVIKELVNSLAPNNIPDIRIGASCFFNFVAFRADKNLQAYLISEQIPQNLANILGRDSNESVQKNLTLFFKHLAIHAGVGTRRVLQAVQIIEPLAKVLASTRNMAAQRNIAEFISIIVQNKNTETLSCLQSKQTLNALVNILGNNKCVDAHRNVLSIITILATNINSDTLRYFQSYQVINAQISALSLGRDVVDQRIAATFFARLTANVKRDKLSCLQLERNIDAFVNAIDITRDEDVKISMLLFFIKLTRKANNDIQKFLCSDMLTSSLVNALVVDSDLHMRINAAGFFAELAKSANAHTLRRWLTGNVFTILDSVLDSQPPSELKENVDLFFERIFQNPHSDNVIKGRCLQQRNVRREILQDIFQGAQYDQNSLDELRGELEDSQKKSYFFGFYSGR